VTRGKLQPRCRGPLAVSSGKRLSTEEHVSGSPYSVRREGGYKGPAYHCLKRPKS